MPTGYTADLHDGKDITFEQFVMRCARGMGALILMRDDPADAPIPEQFEPSDYHPTKLAEAEQALAAFEAMTDQEQTDLYLAERAENLAARTRAKRERAHMLARYQGMLAEVEAWEPPAILASFKDFMVEQLTGSIDFDCHPGTDVYPQPLPEQIEDWYVEKLRKLRWDVDYHRKQLAEEIERTNGRNEWLAALHSSLGSRV